MSNHQSSFSALKLISLVTAFFFSFNLIASQTAYADGLVPGSEDHNTEMSGPALTPDAVLGSTGEWSSEDVEKDAATSAEDEQLQEALTVISEALLEVLVYLLLAIFGFGSLPKTKTDEAADGSKTKTTTFANSNQIKRQEFYDSKGKMVSGYEVYADGTLKWKKTPSTGLVWDNGYETYYDDVPTGEVDENGRPLGRVAEVKYNKGEGTVYHYASETSLNVTKKVDYVGDFLSREMTGYNQYTYFDGTNKIKSNDRYDGNGKLVKSLEYYSSGNLKIRKENGNTYEYDDGLVVVAISENINNAVGVNLVGASSGKLIRQTTDKGTVIVYEYDSNGNATLVTTFDDKGKVTGRTESTYYADTAFVKTRSSYDKDGLLISKETRYESGVVASEYRQSTNQTAYFDDAKVSIQGSKTYGNLMRVVYTGGEDHYAYNDEHQVTQKWSYQNGSLVQMETTDWTAETPVRTVRFLDGKGNTTKTSRYDAESGELISTELARLGSVSSTLPQDYDTTYTQGGVVYRHVVRFFAGTDKLKKVERYENGVLISVNEYRADGSIQSVNAVTQNTLYQFSVAKSDMSTVKLDKITFKNGDKTVDVVKESSDGTRLVVYDRWMRSIKTVFDAGSWIDTEYKNDTFTTDVDRDSKLRETLFDESGMMVRGLVYNSKGTQIRYMVESDGTYVDCFTAECLQHDAGVREVAQMNGVQGASVAVIEAGDAGLEHGEAVSNIISNLSSSRTQVFTGTTHLEVAQAIRNAVDRGFQVVNLSLEFSVLSITNWAAATGQVFADALMSFKAVLQGAVDYARSKNAVVVASAGNNDPELSVLADLNGVVSVGATDLLGRHQGFSNEGAALSLSATGSQVYAVAQSVGKSRLYTGTSFATPIVSAVIAKLVGYLFSVKGSGADTNLVLSALASSADDLGTEGHDSTFGAGKINAAAAFEKLMEFIS